jgi:DNA (cytosine-5)-methyltransferase 1
MIMIRSTQIPFLDFFAGSGLVSVGFHENGFKTIWANDICEKKSKIFQSNLTGTQFHLGSIESVKGKGLPYASVSWASFPCQDLSLAGNLEGLAGERSGLFWEWVRVIQEMKVKPPILIAENVLGLLTAHGGRYYREVHLELERMGYQVGALVIDAKHWVPQSRPRIFIVAVEKRVDVSPFTSEGPNWAHPEKLIHVKNELEGFKYWKIPKPRAKPESIRDIVELDAQVDEIKSKRNLTFVSKMQHQKMREAKKTGQIIFTGYKRTRDGQQKLEVRFDGLSGCIRTAKGGSSKQYMIYFDKSENLVCRFMTPREAARVMGASEDFLLPTNLNDAYSAMGDAVAVPVTSYLAKMLIKPLAEYINAHGD